MAKHSAEKFDNTILTRSQRNRQAGPAEKKMENEWNLGGKLVESVNM